MHTPLSDAPFPRRLTTEDEDDTGFPILHGFTRYHGRMEKEALLILYD